MSRVNDRPRGIAAHPCKSRQKLSLHRECTDLIQECHWSSWSRREVVATEADVEACARATRGKADAVLCEQPSSRVLWVPKMCRFRVRSDQDDRSGDRWRPQNPVCLGRCQDESGRETASRVAEDDCVECRELG